MILGVLVLIKANNIVSVLNVRAHKIWQILSLFSLNDSNSKFLADPIYYFLLLELVDAIEVKPFCKFVTKRRGDKVN